MQIYKEKYNQLTILYLAWIPFKNKREIKKITANQNLRIFIVSKYSLKEVTKKVLKVKSSQLQIV
jgi:hypothetical protein